MKFNIGDLVWRHDEETHDLIPCVVTLFDDDEIWQYIYCKDVDSDFERGYLNHQLIGVDEARKRFNEAVAKADADLINFEKVVEAHNV